jgi:hypothetical protein
MTFDGPVTKAGLRERLFSLGASYLSKLLTLQDRNPHSPTYGCFDRNFWHLRITDFPSGMAQEFVLPLALAYAHSFPGNTFYNNPAIREWVRAGVSYAERSSHSDGSCDDYYPYEKAAGATAFSLYAIIESLPLIHLDPEPYVNFLLRRAYWLGNHQESGRLSNHEALIANTLYRVASLCDDDGLERLARARVDRLLSWQSSEGWFYEYQGCDPGYLTLTLGNMAEMMQIRPELKLWDSIDRGVKFLGSIQPPDGWPSGEWTSRNTNNYFPHGLELIGTRNKQALCINDAAVAAMDPPPEYGDDHILGHHCWSYIKAALNWNKKRPDPLPPTSHNMTFPEAGITIIRLDNFTLLVAEKKGGCFRLYQGAKLLHSDTGISMLLQEGRKIRNYVCHLWSETNEITRSTSAITVAGNMGRAKASQITPFKSIVLRILMLGPGRIKPDLVRRILQRLLITGDSVTGHHFERILELDRTGLTVTDRIHSNRGRILEAGIGPAQTSIYTVMSRVFHSPQLQPWLDLSTQLHREGPVRLEHRRRIGTDN